MKKIIILLVLVALVTGGCSLSIGKKKITNLGVFKSIDSAETWEQKVFAGRTSKNKDVKIDGTQITKLHMHPEDNNTVYLCTIGHGIYVSYDGGELWQKTGLKDGTYVNMAIDNESPETMYAVSKGSIMKSADGGENWENIYVEIKEGEKLTDIAVDHYDPKIVYVTTSKGALLKSSDYGITWRVAHRFETDIKRIYIDPLNSRNLYIITSVRGIYVSNDGGDSWKEVYDELKDINKKVLRINSFVFFKGNPKIIYMATEYGVVKSNDGGEKFELVKTLIKDGIPVDFVSVDPDDVDKLYLVKDNKLHKSENGGDDWKTIQLPTAFFVGDILYDNEETSTIYLGIIKYNR